MLEVVLNAVLSFLLKKYDKYLVSYLNQEKNSEPLKTTRKILEIYWDTTNSNKIFRVCENISRNF
jgi:hypothetical protein